ncbi:hypothetical protein BBO99_00000870 [Phytophthora kernoviae]|uniref:M96 mating-specific protein family n=2 Tax=Phytophthora kernoviae TaxID=325452 RepID=A0A3R7I1F0_9STRA|nr:hypothetical protein G195_001537 [Phytophthora kernoviae 00238/432]KAG2531822.1 hypothetical protein JM16_000695 [Phytophthora kernoviae]RLN44418.1 hypothetical protein BBI17_000949 [Phytophthora kernoviae]RLN85053.1 hypothetical protein BBO99_00000870 [Phytophthora kernoviae]
MDIRADATDFQQLLGYLDAAYHDVEAVLAANGLATMEITQHDVHIREGVDGMYLEVFSNKAMPFGLRAVAEATWNYFKGSKKHRGNLYAKEAQQNLETPYTIIEHFTKELLAGNSSTDVRIKQVVRRYVEAEREVVVWVAIVAPLETTRKPFKPYAGFTSHHCNYAVIKHAKASASEQELSLLQLVSHVTVNTKDDTISDPKYVRVLTDVLLSNTAGNMRALMAFLAEDDDAMHAFEAVLSFVDDFVTDANASSVNNAVEIHESIDDKSEIPSLVELSPDPNAKDRREKAERENVRLKLILEGQIKVAKSLESLLLKRAQQQMAECCSVHAPGDVVSQPGRTLDFRADAEDFQELLGRLDVAYRSVDAVLASNGLAEMEMMHQDIHMREGVDGMYLELFSNKVMPFGLDAMAEATWSYFKGSEKHRGNLYAKAAQNLETPYTIIEHFSKELVAGNSSTDVRVKQIVRRYVEAEREVVVWVASIAPIEITRKPFAGLSSYHRNYAIIKRAKVSTSERELSLLQLVAHVALDTREGTIYDPNSHTSSLAVAMAFLEDDDALHALEEVLNYVETFTLDQSASEGITGNEETATQLLADHELEIPSLSIDNGDHSDTAANIAMTEARTSHPPPLQLIHVSTGHPVSEATREGRRAVNNAKKRLLRKAGVYGNPNRARNERKLEIAYLREKVGQLELELGQLQDKPEQALMAVVTMETQEDGENARASTSEAEVSSIWKGLATRQRYRREKAERENVRLKIIVESQIKVAKSLESLLVKRAREQMAECSSIQTPDTHPGRTLDFRTDAAEFQDLLEHLDAAYRDIDAIFAANGLAGMEMTQQDVHVREGVDGMYLEVFSNKVIPFGLQTTADATWNHFKGSEKHRGILYAKAAQNLETPDTIIENFSKELFAENSSTDVRVKQIVRRYVEAERVVIVWVATLTPVEIKRKMFEPYAGLTSHHRNFAVIKRPKASTTEQELSLLQLVSHVSLGTKDAAIYDAKFVRTFTDFLLSNAARNIKADQELIENVFMDQTLSV